MIITCTAGLVLVLLLLLLLWLNQEYPRVGSFLLAGYAFFILFFIVGFIAGMYTVPNHILDMPNPGPYFAWLGRKGLNWGAAAGIIAASIFGIAANLRKY